MTVTLPETTAEYIRRLCEEKQELEEKIKRIQLKNAQCYQDGYRDMAEFIMRHPEAVPYLKELDIDGLS